MNVVIPAIIPQSAEDLITKVASLTFAQRVQVDVVDGVFVPSASWPYEPQGTLAEVAAIFEHHEIMVDIMASDQYSAAELWLEAGAKEIVVHLEAVVDIHALRTLTSAHQARLWVAANDTAPVAAYQAIKDVVDGIQLMGIHTIGKQGEPFSDLVLQNIKAVRACLPEKPIMIDGSVNETTLRQLVAAGADQFVVGSAIMGAENPATAYQKLVAQL